MLDYEPQLGLARIMVIDYVKQIVLNIAALSYLKTTNFAF